jgi:hypothetical protein
MINLKRLSLILFLICAAVITTVAQQQFLILKSKTSAKTHKLYINDLVQIKSLQGVKVKGHIFAMSETAIQVGPESFDYAELEYIRTYNSFGKGVGKSLQYGSLFFGGIFLVNGLITGSSPVLTQANLVFVGVMAAAGIILELISQHKHLLKNYRLEYLILPYE